MKLKDLLSAVPNSVLIGDPETEISGISLDSRAVKKGDLFAALPGMETHGRNYLGQAESAGAAAILSDQEIATRLPVIVAKNARLALALISNHFYDYPSRKIKLIGVTGTNGKTTIAFLIRAMFQAAGIPCGLIGTIHYSGQHFSKSATHTTPEAPELQRLLKRLVNEQSGACAMEVSSQGLDQFRVAGTDFETSIFTNLTHEHLDYHGTMQGYFKAKMMLFDNETCNTKIAVSNFDDPFGKTLREIRSSKHLATVTYGFENGADFLMKDWITSTRGSKMKILHDGKDYAIKTRLVGQYNLYNICAAFAAASVNDLPRKAILAGIKNMSYVPGRMEQVDFGQPFKIMIDYAHTDDAFRQLLPTLRLYTANRIIHIFGCRGGKDKSKRPKMGKVAGELGDIVILSSDNPKNEGPEKIAEQVFVGLRASGNPNVHVILDRAEAIAFAVSMAEPGDTIVITGKGNETYQLIGNKKYPFDERELFLAAVESVGATTQ
jgi:UDP-N-acetylmuramoyl-L-alanyl-D-glutamate--2,6-diaminopimelate ligase